MKNTQICSNQGQDKLYILCNYLHKMHGVRIVPSVQRLATDWTVRDRIPVWGEGEIFSNRPDQPWDPPSFLYNEYRVFPGVKAAGA